jgi:MFS transporter, SP family, sugar:H+ symporter
VTATPGNVAQAEPEHTTARTVAAAVTAAIGGFLFGYDTSVINGAVDAIGGTFDAGSFVLGFAVSSALLGSAVGAWYAGRLADRWGRPRVMVIAAALFFVTAIGSGSAFAIWDLTIWRFLGGMAIGAASIIAPAYIAEISPARIRGRLGSLQQLAIVTGIFVSLLVDYVLATAAGGASQDLWFGVPAWRWMFIMLVIPALVYGLMALRLPESPRFLVAAGRIPEARKVLKRFIGLRVEERLREIEQSLRSDHPFRMSDLRGSRLGLLPIVWAGLIIAAFQQFVGINVIFYYSTVLWQAVGFNESDSMLITVITSVTNIATTLVAIALIDKVGRKPLLLTGSGGMAVSLAVMAIAFGAARITTLSDGTEQPVLEGAWGPIALIAANLFVVFFGCTWGPVMWVMLGEMFSNRIRASALALCGAVQWLANWLVTVSFPALKSVSLGLTYGIYAICAVLSFVLVLKWITETKNRELEDMADT